jgi:predicted helicase
MPSDHREELRRIRTFPQFVKYLQDHLGWPVETDSFDDLTFDYEPEDLGLDSKTSAKIRKIRQLRPLVTDQPWGIFFVEFEPKRLPIVALRRILGQLVFKKRASANRAERPSWNLHDLLFISAYGEGDAREISLAHFSEDSQMGDLATLRVLGWDGQDTGLHLDHVHHELTNKLCWPDDPDNADAWRQTWSSAFTLRPREVIATSKDLAVRLADLASAIRRKVNAALAVETENGRLRKLMKAFQESLIHDLKEDDFADMYAQTIAYGLLSARVSRPAGLVAEDVVLMVPATNPFLKELMETFLHIGGRKRKSNGEVLDFDELGINEVIDTLRDANMEAVLRDFDNRNPQEDPVIHFYELFLKEYDPKRRMQRGVFYTPKPVVSYIVRSVHELLQTEFGLEDGLASTVTWREMADRFPPLPPGEGRGEGSPGGIQIPEGTDPDSPFVTILDPATGTATFLVEVIKVIHRTLAAKWKARRLNDAQQRAAWNDYVPKHLLPRLYGYELMMAPYAIAHMKIGLKLAETGYRFGTEERVRVYLTNALEPWIKQLSLIGFDALAHEAAAVNDIKRHKRFTAVIGNPPYTNYGQLNTIPFILNLLDDYKRGLQEKKLNLDDDFVKFVRFGQFAIQQAGIGVFGMVTNNTFLDGITHRRMRECLLECFNLGGVVDLHGSATKKETCPDGSKDENVFEIKQGVGISIFARVPQTQRRLLLFGELWGLQDSKYALLESGRSLSNIAIEVAAPNFFFVPKSVENAEEYARGISVKDAFTESGPGIKTERDNVGIQHTRSAMEAVIDDFKSNAEDELRKKYDLGNDSRDWKIATAKADAMENDNAQRIRPVLYRPFDFRWTWYSGKTRGFIGTPGFRIGSHMSKGPNLGFITSRTVYGPDSWRDALVTNTICEFGIMATRPGNTAPVFPLYLYEESLAFDVAKKGADASHGFTKRPNLTPSFLRAVARALRLEQQKPCDLPAGVTPEDIFHYAYAVFHSPSYRSRYAELLKIDFPRLPLTGSLDLFRVLAQLGGELVALHLLESPKLATPITEFIGGRNPAVEKVSWSRDTVWVDKAQSTGFRGVREPVWEFHIGGYQVCQKWLKDRKGRTLSTDDIVHYQKIVVALSETIRLMREIDETIGQHGGWPGAFVTQGTASADDQENAAPFA